MCFVRYRRGDVAVMNLSDPSHWVMERILPSVGGRTLGGDGHSDIVRCADVDFKVSHCSHLVTTCDHS